MGDIIRDVIVTACMRKMMNLGGKKNQRGKSFQKDVFNMIMMFDRQLDLVS